MVAEDRLLKLRAEEYYSMSQPLTFSRRNLLAGLAALGAGGVLAVRPSRADDSQREPSWDAATRSGLEYLARTQNSRGQWNTPPYSVALSALAGTALLASGSTASQGPYAMQIAKTADFLISKSRDNGLIGDPAADVRYTYGHGFSMLFLSQLLGEEGLEDRREEIIRVLEKAVDFCIKAQTPSGGWGYVSARDGNNYDEGSTTITQVQGLRGCRNAGIPVTGEVIEQAKKYIYSCKNASDGGISYSSKQMGTSRPAITAAALAALYNAGDYDSQHVPEMLAYCRKTLHEIATENQAFGHWHYTYLYYSQVVYRQGNAEWIPFRGQLYARIVSEQQSDGSWNGQIHNVYVTACNLIMLQLDKGFLPIFQR